MLETSGEIIEADNGKEIAYKSISQESVLGNEGSKRQLRGLSLTNHRSRAGTHCSSIALLVTGISSRCP